MQTQEQFDSAQDSFKCMDLGALYDSETIVPVRGYSKEKIFYVYLHKKPGTDEVFYVGKGKGNRAYDKRGRNNHWNNLVKKLNGFDVEIIKSDLIEQEAFDLEIETIKHYGIEKLTNKALGGISTTGYTHSEETKSRLSQIQKDLLSNLSPEEKKRRYDLQTAWIRDKENYERVSKTFNKRVVTEEEKQKASERSRRYWLQLSPEEKQKFSDRARKQWLDLDAEAKKRRIDTMLSGEVSEKNSFIGHALVVNGLFVVSPIKSFSPVYSGFHKAKESANKLGFDFFVSKGYLYEEYDDKEHSNLPKWAGEDIPKLDFNCLPRSKAVVMDESKVFLSIREAASYCVECGTIENTADFITKSLQKGRPAMQHMWRVATTEEIKQEVLRRLEDLLNKIKEQQCHNQK